MTSVAQSATDVDEGRLDSAHAPAVRWGGTRARLELLHGLYILATLAVIIEATGAAPSLGASVALAALWATAQPITRAVFARRPYRGPFIVAASASLLGLVLASLAGFWFQGLEGHGDNLLMVAAFAFVVSATAQALLRWNVGTGSERTSVD